MTTGTLARRHAQLRRHTGRIARELAHAKRQEAEARQAATHDPLTGALNRLGLAEAWQSRDPSGLLLFDLDGFKPVNDEYGHATGDRVLNVVAERLAAADTVVARLGGDEFAVLTVGGDPVERAEALRDLVGAPIQLGPGLTVQVSASVGVRQLDDAIELNHALADADHAMYAAKSSTDASAVVWTPELSRPELAAGDRLRDQGHGRGLDHEHAGQDDQDRDDQGLELGGGTSPEPRHQSTTASKRDAHMTDSSGADASSGRGQRGAPADATSQAADERETGEPAAFEAVAPAASDDEHRTSYAHSNDDGWEL